MKDLDNIPPFLLEILHYLQDDLSIELAIAIPILAFLEACVGVGLFISGVFLLSTCALVYTTGEVSLPLILIMAFSGAMLGDHAGYFVGYGAAPQLWRSRWVRKKVVRHKAKYRKFRQLLSRSAPWAICIGRLTPALRSLSPMLAGAAGVTPTRFFLYDLLACSIWGTGLAVILLSINQFA